MDDVEISRAEYEEFKKWKAGGKKDDSITSTTKEDLELDKIKEEPPKKPSLKDMAKKEDKDKLFCAECKEAGIDVEVKQNDLTCSNGHELVWE